MNLKPLNKFDYKCSKGIFLGYSPNQKAYYVLNEDHKIITSRDVLFEESTPGAEHFDLRGEIEFKEDIDNDSDYNVEDEEFSSDNDGSQHDEENLRKRRASFGDLTRPKLESSEESNNKLDNSNAADLKVGFIDASVRSDLTSGDVLVGTIDASTRSGVTSSESMRKSNRKREKTKPYWILLSSEKLKDPETYKEAINSPNATEWIDAMHAEINSLNENQTWILVPKPRDRKIISSKWVYKTKYNLDGTIERYKARLVAKGFTQNKDIDYHETFVPV